jgi:hypothetical protein
MRGKKGQTLEPKDDTAIVMLALSTGMWIFLSPYDTQLS